MVQGLNVHVLHIHHDSRQVPRIETYFDNVVSVAGKGLQRLHRARINHDHYALAGVGHQPLPSPAREPENESPSDAMGYS